MIAQSIGRATVLQLDHRLIRRLLATDLEFSNAVAHEIQERLIDTAREFHQRFTGSLPRRLARELLDVAAQLGEGDPVKITFTHESLADSLGSSREVVSRVLAAFARRSLVLQLGRGQLEIIHPDELLAIATDIEGARGPDPELDRPPR